MMKKKTEEGKMRGFVEYTSIAQVTLWLNLDETKVQFNG